MHIISGTVTNQYNTIQKQLGIVLSGISNGDIRFYTNIVCCPFKYWWIAFNSALGKGLVLMYFHNMEEGKESSGERVYHIVLIRNIKGKISYNNVSLEKQWGQLEKCYLNALPTPPLRN